MLLLFDLDCIPWWEWIRMLLLFDLDCISWWEWIGMLLLFDLDCISWWKWIRMLLLLILIVFHDENELECYYSLILHVFHDQNELERYYSLYFMIFLKKDKNVNNSPSSDPKRTNNSLLESPRWGASNDSKITYSASIDGLSFLFYTFFMISRYLSMLEAWSCYHSTRLIEAILTSYWWSF